MRALIPLVITLAIQALVSMASLSVPVIAPAISAATGHPAALAGLFIAIVYGVAMLSSLAAGGLVTRWGPIRVSQMSLILSAAGLVIGAQGSLPALAASAALLGLGYGPVTPASSHILIHNTPPERLGLIFSIKQTGVPLGAALAGLLLPAVTRGVGWGWALAMVAAVCLLVAVISQVLRRVLDADRMPNARAFVWSRLFAPLQLINADRALRDIAFCSFVFGAIQLCLTTYLTVWLTESYGMSLIAAGGLMALMQGSAVIGRLLWGWLADRFGNARAILGGLAGGIALCTLSFAVIGPGWPVTIVGAATIIGGATAIGWNGVYLAEVARLAPKGMAGTVTGGTLFLTYFGVVIGPPVFSLALVVTGGFPVPFLGLAVIATAMGGFLTLSNPHPRRRVS